MIVDPVQQILDRLDGVTQTGEGRWQAFCPLHENPPQGHKRSLSVSKGEDSKALVFCHACGKKATPSILTAIGLTDADLFSEARDSVRKSRGLGRIVAPYDYRDAEGTLLYQVVRFDPKDFRPRRPDGKGGWIWNLNGVRRVPYRLPELLAADPGAWVFQPEGEKDCNRLAGAGLTATTNPMGAGKWRDEYAEFLRGRRVAILPDNDRRGQDHAVQVARSLTGKATDVRIVQLPGLPDKGDISDWLNDGGTPEKLLALVEAAPTYRPAVPKIEPGKYRLSDTGNADRLVALHGQDLRFVPNWGKWLVYDGVRWARDDMLEIHRRAEEVVRAIYGEAAAADSSDLRKETATWAGRSDSARSIDAMLTCAKPKCAARPSDFDGDRWVLNVNNGTLDLKTGKLRPHRREDMLTKMSGAAYDPDARHDLWNRFLADATGGDEELSSFLRRAVGYSLTGRTCEEKMFFVHGPAATGKSTFVEAVRAALGDYAMTADFETFLARRFAGGPRNDVARLAGARLVVGVEVTEGKRLAEGLVKTLTGGDTVSARFLYKEAFEFRPQFKLWLAANHAPTVRDDDDAMWRRILRIPFEAVVPKARRDPALKAALRDDDGARRAVLAWAVRGCREWEADGLGVPPAVKAATEAYREDMNPLADFLADCCVVAPLCAVPRADLRREYEAWAREQGIKPVSGKEFARRLRALGAEDAWVHAGRAWRGIGLRAAPEGGATNA